MINQTVWVVERITEMGELGFTVGVFTTYLEAAAFRSRAGSDYHVKEMQLNVPEEI